MVSASNRWLAWAGLGIVLGGVVLYAGGFLSGERIAPGDSGERPKLDAPTETTTAVRRSVPIFEESVGTVRSRRTVAVSAQVPARVTQVAVEAGQAVKAGDVLATLDDREFAARVAQTRQAVLAAQSGIARAEQARTQAQARATQAKSARERTKVLFEGGAATSEQLEAAEAAFSGGEAAVAEGEAAVAMAKAEHARALQMTSEAEVALGYTRLVAPLDGVVAERSVEAGDLALPGHPLFVVLDPARLRVDARVREGLVGRLKSGDELTLQFDTLAMAGKGRVSEVLPSADARSRTFEVRVDFDGIVGARPGMFARLRIPAGEREVVLAPIEAIARVGQLASVIVEDRGEWKRRLVTLGGTPENGLVEVLSGLAGGERIGRGGAR